MASNIWFVTGKGGVGRSVVAAAMAKKQASMGKRVLLAELGVRSYFHDFLALEVDYQPKPTLGGFDIAIWDAQKALHEYVLYYFKLESIYKLIFDNALARTFLNVAPSAAELAILGKITSGIRKIGPPLNYDVIVVDCYATGHFLALLRGPIGILNALKFGPIAKESKNILQVLKSADIAKFFIVTVAEDLPVTESIELFSAVDQEIGRESEFILNRCGPELPEGFSTLSQEQKNSFTDFLTEKQRLEAEAKDRLQVHSRVREIPLIANKDPWGIIDGVAAAL